MIQFDYKFSRVWFFICSVAGLVSMFTRQNRSHAKCQVKIYDVHNTRSRKLTELGVHFPYIQLFFGRLCVDEGEWQWRCSFNTLSRTYVSRMYNV